MEWKKNAKSDGEEAKEPKDKQTETTLSGNREEVVRDTDRKHILRLAPSLNFEL